MTEKSLKLSIRRRFSSCLQNQFFPTQKDNTKICFIRIKNKQFIVNDKAGFDTGSDLKLRFLVFNFYVIKLKVNLSNKKHFFI